MRTTARQTRDNRTITALVHEYAQPIEFIMFFDLTQKNVTC
jgi:hypothetical protein